jgi:hypothetical protein
MEQTEFKLGEHELQILENFSQARLVKEMMSTQGWGVFLKLKDERIKELERQFWAAAPKMDRDATWVAAMRKEAIVSFLNLWIVEIEQKVECLEPEVMERIIRQATNPTELDGDFSQ